MACVTRDLEARVAVGLRHVYKLLPPGLDEQLDNVEMTQRARSEEARGPIFGDGAKNLFAAVSQQSLNDMSMALLTGWVHAVDPFFDGFCINQLLATCMNQKLN